MPLPKKKYPLPRKRLKPPKNGPYSDLWRIVDGAVMDAFNKHPEYLTDAGAHGNAARRSVTKRVTGAVLGFAMQALPASTESRGEPTADKG